MQPKFRSEETRRSITLRVVRDDHEITITLTATCQESGSAAAVADVFLMAREQLEKSWRAAGES